MTTFTIAMIGLGALVLGAGIGILIGKEIGTFGENTWDGRSGGEVNGDAQLKSYTQSKKRYYEYHIIWTWKPSMFCPRRGLKRLCERAYLVFAGKPDDKQAGEPEFWPAIKALKDDSSWVSAVESVEGAHNSGAGWVFRSFDDVDEQGRNYKAIEASARLFFNLEGLQKSDAYYGELLERFLRKDGKLSESQLKCLAKALESSFQATAGLRELMKL